MAAEDGRMMDHALALARRRVGATGSRPAVGAVISRGGRVIGRGATGPDGRPHAEAAALAMACERHGPAAVRGATAHVSLEPCAHHGATPPCADALIEAGIARVVAPFEDPDPRVSGRGFARLRAAGIEVETGLRAAEAREVNRGFLSRIERGRPWLTLKLAASLDGRIATASGESRWITGQAARRRVHLMRMRAGAVLVGAGTAQADDPMLDVRGYGRAAPQPLRVVLDSRLGLDPGSRLARSAGAHSVLVLHGAGAPGDQAASLNAAGVRTRAVAGGANGRPGLRAALEALAEEGVGTVLSEGGGTLAAALLGAGLVDEIVLFTAGAALGSEAVGAIGPLALERLADAPRFAPVSVEQVGADVLTFWRPLAGSVEMPV